MLQFSIKKKKTRKQLYMLRKQENNYTLRGNLDPGRVDFKLN